MSREPMFKCTTCGERFDLSMDELEETEELGGFNMAGCFGNHPFDRAMEHQLYQYLGECQDYESLCEKICEKIPDDLWDIHDDFANKIIDKYLGVRVERGLMTIEEAQNLLLRMVEMVEANLIYSSK